MDGVMDKAALVNRIIELEKALEYAIEQADSWYDNDTGHGEIDTEEMKKAKELINYDTIYK